jgi:hypothetical protein
LIDAFDPRVFLTNHVAGGAVKRVGETDTAFPHRNAELMLVFVTGWGDPAMDEEMIQATKAQYAALEPYMGGYYDNIEFDGDEAGSRGSTTPATCSGSTATSSRRPDQLPCSKSSCRHASYTTTAAALDRFRLRLPALIGNRSLCSSGRLSSSAWGRPRVSGPMRNTSPAR